MSIAEQFAPRSIWPGSTAPAGLNPASIQRKFTIFDEDVPSDLDLTDQITNPIDFTEQPWYVSKLLVTGVTKPSYIIDYRCESVDLTTTKNPRMIAVDSVARGGAIVVSLISAMSLLATWLSGAIIIQPIFAGLLIILSIGFYTITLAKV